MSVGVHYNTGDILYPIQTQHHLKITSGEPIRTLLTYQRCEGAMRTHAHTTMCRHQPKRHDTIDTVRESYIGPNEISITSASV